VAVEPGVVASGNPVSVAEVTGSVVGATDPVGEAGMSVTAGAQEEAMKTATRLRVKAAPFGCTLRKRGFIGLLLSEICIRDAPHFSPLTVFHPTLKEGKSSLSRVDALL
jgi:hypothetical protein